jgi:VIT1/CCC1 family predicted Fe2+/Mn2+ transporter
MKHGSAEMHRERHSIEKIGWLRAAVLGANDGIVSTASLLLGVASANVTHQSILLTGIAGLVAGAMSMATGEYVSVSSQADTEKAALAEEQAELDADFQGEFRELTAIYVHRGLDVALAKQVAEKLMSHDALAAHAREELGISEITTARPLQAALTSAASFSTGAILPLLVAAIVPAQWAIPAIALSALISLAILGGIAAKAGGAPIGRGIIRITFWSALAMGVSSGVGALFGSMAG